MRNWVCLFLMIFSIAASAEDQPSVLVKTEPMRKEAMTISLSGYGMVFSDPASTVNINQSRSGQIVRLEVTAGQVVKRGMMLFEFATDPGAANGYAQAESSLEMARSSFESTKRLYAKQLATNAQLATAKKTLKDAESAVGMQRELGTEMTRENVKAPCDAVVSGVFASPGDRLQAGKTVLQLARRDALRVRIGVQPEDAPKIRAGMTVRLFPVFDSALKLTGVVSEVHGILDRKTHLVDVIVRIGKSQSIGLVPGMTLRGKIEIPGGNEWVVPRSAVLSDENGAYIFQDDTGRAKRIDVHAIENGGITAIQGKFDPHLPVVVLGNYELRDGMKLREQNR